MKMTCEEWWRQRNAPIVFPGTWHMEVGYFYREPMMVTVGGIQMWRGEANKLRHLVNTGPRR